MDSLLCYPELVTSTSFVQLLAKMHEITTVGVDQWWVQWLIESYTISIWTVAVWGSWYMGTWADPCSRLRRYTSSTEPKHWTWTLCSLDFNSERLHFFLPFLQMEKGDDINIKQVLLNMRKYRMGLIQTPDQLRFSYMAIIEGAKCIKGDSNIQVNFS